MKYIKNRQFGRSMIEMLGVLAIIGVLSAGGIKGYSVAMEMYKVNKFVDAIADSATKAVLVFNKRSEGNSSVTMNVADLCSLNIPDNQYCRTAIGLASKGFFGETITIQLKDEQKGVTGANVTTGVDGTVVKVKKPFSWIGYIISSHIPESACKKILIHTGWSTMGEYTVVNVSSKYTELPLSISAADDFCDTNAKNGFSLYVYISTSGFE